jgi:hypothetical protein
MLWSCNRKKVSSACTAAGHSFLNDRCIVPGLRISPTMPHHPQAPERPMRRAIQTIIQQSAQVPRRCILPALNPSLYERGVWGAGENGEVRVEEEAKTGYWTTTTGQVSEYSATRISTANQSPEEDLRNRAPAQWPRSFARFAQSKPGPSFRD